MVVGRREEQVVRHDAERDDGRRPSSRTRASSPPRRPHRSRATPRRAREAAPGTRTRRARRTRRGRSSRRARRSRNGHRWSSTIGPTMIRRSANARMLTRRPSSSSIRESEPVAGRSVAAAVMASISVLAAQHDDARRVRVVPRRHDRLEVARSPCRAACAPRPSRAPESRNASWLSSPASAWWRTSGCPRPRPGTSSSHR